MTAWKVTLLATQWLLISTQAAPSQKCLTTTASIPPHCMSAKVPIDLQRRLILPPKEFDHDFDGRLDIRHGSVDEIRSRCAMAIKDDFDRPALACAAPPPLGIGDPKTCTVYMMFEGDYVRLGWDYSLILRHEIGHCNGGRHDNQGNWYR